MADILKILLLLLCVLIFSVRTVKKISIMYFSFICLSAVSLGNGGIGHSGIVLPLCFFLSMFFEHKKRISESVINVLMIISVASIFILYFHSPIYAGIGGLIKLFIYEFINGNLVLLVGMLALKERSDLYLIYSTIYYSTLFLAFFGVLNLLLGVSPWLELLDVSFNFIGWERFRIQSMFIFPFDYGYMCILLLMFSYYGYKEKYLTKKRWHIILSCSLFGIILGGCRTILVCFIISIATYMLIWYKLRKSIKYIVYISVLFVFGYALFPAVKEKTDFVLTAFDKDNQQLGSSSLSMREEQTLAVLSYITSEPLYGRGYGFFYHELNWSEGHDGSADNSLQGLEGVYLSYLLERGFVGYGLYLLFYIILLRDLWNKRKIDNFSATMAFVLVVTYLAFSHMTGELLSLCPTLLSVGLLMKIINIRKYEISSNNNTCI